LGIGVFFLLCLAASAGQAIRAATTTAAERTLDLPAIMKHLVFTEPL